MVASFASGGLFELIDNPADGFVPAPEPDGAKEDFPQAIVDGFEADVKFSEQVTHVHPPIVPANAAVAIDDRLRRSTRGKLSAERSRRSGWLRLAGRN